MKTNFKQSLAILLVMLMVFVCVQHTNAQILKIEGRVTLDKVSSFEQYNVQVLDMDSNTVSEFKACKKFTYKFQFNKSYMVVISKKGYQSKSIFFNTTCDSNDAFKYIFDCNLQSNVEQLNVVCQAGGIFYNPHKQNFDFYYH